MVAYPGYTLKIKILILGSPIVVHDTHTRKKEVHLKANNIIFMVFVA